MPNRYNGAHIDLLDQLTFYGAARGRFSSMVQDLQDKVKV